MIALAVYFCFADLVLVTQCVYYNVINARRHRPHSTLSTRSDADDPERPLLDRRSSENLGLPGSRRRSSASYARRDSHASDTRTQALSGFAQEKDHAVLVWTKNAMTVVAICAAGAAGWFLAWKAGAWVPIRGDDLSSPAEDMAIGAQILGYSSSACYLG